MASSGPGTENGVNMADILETLTAIQEGQNRLTAEWEAVAQRLDGIAIPELAGKASPPIAALPSATGSPLKPSTPGSAETVAAAPAPATEAAAQAQQSGFTSRIILTTYPKQIGINPLPLNWGAPAPERGPVVVSRSSSTIRKRNAIGAHGGSYSIYFALALASKQLNANHRPDFTNAEPAANIGPFPQWSDKKKIVAMDPWGHLGPWLFKDIMEKENVDIRPTIAITKAHMKLPELQESVRSGRLYVLPCYLFPLRGN
ncbi:GTP cyclohydrolase N terminal-domain-containing protein [Xylariaceae sp. FL0804]|nr:GTP cyclohydrolase N terminal-domain-containing protein [Xylariaceae sp. FL0804]